MRKAKILFMCVTFVVTFFVDVSLSQNSAVSDSNQIPSKQDGKWQQEWIMWRKIDGQVRNGQIGGYYGAKKIAEIHHIEYTQEQYAAAMLYRINTMVQDGKLNYSQAKSMGQANGIVYTEEMFNSRCPKVATTKKKSRV